ncbi:Gfo/Idh/MocA family oxidoreductase [bacterium]|nr:Gfo/Idh/MocA family oxidoreductase [bacterium]
MTIKVGVLGCGYWGPNLLRNLTQMRGVKVERACDIDEKRLDYIRERYPHLKRTRDYKRFLKDSNIDAIVIATPVASHYQLTKENLLAGKDVLVEKPLALTSAQCRELIEIAEKKKRILMVGHTFLYNMAVRKLREYIKKGELGKIYYTYSARLNLGRIRRDVNALWNFAPHDISILLYLLGKRPKSVRTWGSSCIQKGVEDVVFLNLDFPGGITAHIHMSWVDPNKVRRMTVVGSKKMVVYDDTHPDEKVRVYDRGFEKVFFQDTETFGEFQLKLRAGGVYSPEIRFVEPLKVECAHFIECIKKRKKPLTDGRNGLKVVRILEAAQKSLDNDGAPIKL